MPKRCAQHVVSGRGRAYYIWRMCGDSVSKRRNVHKIARKPCQYDAKWLFLREKCVSLSVALRGGGGLGGYHMLCAGGPDRSGEHTSCGICRCGAFWGFGGVAPEDKVWISMSRRGHGGPRRPLAALSLTIRVGGWVGNAPDRRNNSRHGCRRTG